MPELSAFLKDVYESNARCLTRMGMSVAADRYWRALDRNRIISPLSPEKKPATGFTENGVLVTERVMAMIMEKPRSIPEIADAVVLTKSAVVHHIIKLCRDGKIIKVGKRGRNPLWGAT